MKVAICVPCMNQVDSRFMECLVEMVATTVAQYVAPGYADFNLFTYNSSYIAWSRTELAKGAIAWGATHILFLDSDMTFPHWTFHHLFKRDVPVVGANYARRRPPHAPVTFKSLTPGGAEDSHQLCYTHPDSTGLEEVEAIGFGVVLIQAQVFDQIKTAPFRVLDDEMSKERVGEDVYFCQLLKQAGIPVYIDHDLSHHVGHMGMQEFHNQHSVVAREIAQRQEPQKPKLTLVGA